MNVLIADKFDQSGIDELQALGVTVCVDPALGPDTLPAAIKEHDPDVLVVRSTKVPSSCFDVGTKLTLVIRAGASTSSGHNSSASRTRRPVFTPKRLAS